MVRVETVNGRYLLCGHILKVGQIKPGQQWAPASGGNSAVTVISIDGGRVRYSGSQQPMHEKDSFSFQCRYCLILATAEIPEGLK